MFGSIMKKKDKTPSGLNDRSNSDIGDSYEQNQVSSAVFHAPGSLQNSSGSKAPPLATHTKEESFSDSGLTIDNTTTPTIKNKKSAGVSFNDLLLRRPFLWAIILLIMQVFGGFMRKSKDRGQPSDSSPEDVRKNNDYNNNQNIGRSSSIELRNSAHEQSELVISDTESPVKAKKRNV